LRQVEEFKAIDDRSEIPEILAPPKILPPKTPVPPLSDTTRDPNTLRDKKTETLSTKSHTPIPTYQPTGNLRGESHQSILSDSKMSTERLSYYPVPGLITSLWGFIEPFILNRSDRIALVKFRFWLISTLSFIPLLIPVLGLLLGSLPRVNKFAPIVCIIWMFNTSYPPLLLRLLTKLTHGETLLSLGFYKIRANAMISPLILLTTYSSMVILNIYINNIILIYVLVFTLAIVAGQIMHFFFEKRNYGRENAVLFFSYAILIWISFFGGWRVPLSLHFQVTRREVDVTHRA
jgi:hypothetical protein